MWLFCSLAQSGGNSHSSYSNRLTLPAAEGKGKERGPLKGTVLLALTSSLQILKEQMPKVLLYLQVKKSQTFHTPFGRNRALTWNGCTVGVCFTHRKNKYPLTVLLITMLDVFFKHTQCTILLKSKLSSL